MSKGPVILPGHIYCTAEIGINANGDAMIAKQLIKEARAAGFDCVKFQKRTINEVYTVAELDAARESPWGTTNREQKEGIEFNAEDFNEIDEYCRLLGIEWTASPWDLKSVDFLMNYDLPYLKIASASATDKALVEHCVGTGLPIFISTGGCNQRMVDKIVEWAPNLECLYHCCGVYPAENHEINLLAIVALRERYPNIPCIGYSGHEAGLPPSLYAVALGAGAVERHITLNRAMYGSDQAASLEPQGFNRLIRDIRAWEVLKGSGHIGISDRELAVMRKLRKRDDTVGGGV
jgi:N-acetylneuraminate synthase|tara:strand:+ start:31920 stop:32795 length:876 start_codon:yes stop_codon:yes gene_type:complete